MGGLGTAIRLQAAGYQVTVFEANAYAGGKLTEVQQDGFRFDAGPSLFTLPQLVDELFEVAGKNPRDYFAYQRLDNICRYFFPDGTRLDAWSDAEKFAEEIEKVTGEPKEKVAAFLRKSEKIYELTKDIFLYRSVHKLSTYTSRSAFKTLLNLPTLGIFSTMAGANKRWFSDPRVIQLFNRYATYNGSDPYKAPSTLNIIPHLEHNMGAWFPQGGMHRVSQSLFELAQDIGVEFQFNSRVEKILIEGKKAQGIQVKGKKIPAPLVISNMDVVNAYKHLLADQKQPKRILKQPKSSSALIFYWGMEGSYPDLDLHNIFFTKDYPAEFDQIFNKKDLLDDPTVYLYVSAKLRPEDAPQGHENWFAMINVPNNEGQDWDALIQRSRENILNKLEKNLGRELRSKIVCEDILDPRLIESRTSSFGGALYGNSSNNKFAAFLRHANFSSRMRGLYFCGGSVHPGGGIPLCLLSARIVSDMILK